MALTKISTGMLKADAASVDLNIDAGTLFLDVSNNRVGIATTSPGQKLEVASGHIKLSAGYSLQWDDSHERIEQSDGNLEFFTNNSQQMTISGSNVGIGTTAPTSTVDIRGTHGATHSRGQLYLSNTESHAINQGSQISLGGTYSGTYDTYFASIAGRKENATSGNYAGYLQFATRGSGTSNTERMRITSTGNVGIGITAPDNKLHVYKGNSGHTWSFDGGDGIILENSDSLSINIAVPAANSGNILFSDANARGQGRISYTHNNDAMSFMTGGISNERMRIDSSGNVGIRTSSPSATLEVGTLASGQTGNMIINHEGGSTPVLQVKSRTNRATISVGDNDTFGYISSEDGIFSIGRNSGLNANNININASNNVGIGTTTPNYLLDVEGTGSLFRVHSTSGAAVLQLQVSDTTSINDINFGDTGATARGQIRYRHNGDSLAFSTVGVERMRIDSSGRLLIGTTSTTPGFSTTNGHAFHVGDASHISRDQGVALVINRGTNDGGIVQFRKSGTYVGAIESRAGVVTTLLLNPASGNGAGISGGTKCIVPADEGGIIDNDISLGIGTHRFKDLHLSGTMLAGSVANVYTSSDRAYFVAGTNDSSNQHVYLGSYHGSTLKLLTFSGSNNALYPQTTASIDLGLSTHKFKDLNLSGMATIHDITSDGVIRSTNNANVDGPNFNVSTTNKDTAEYAYRVDRSGTVVGGLRIDGNAVINSRLTFGYNSHYFEAGTNRVDFKNSSGSSYITITNTGTSITGQVLVGGNDSRFAENNLRFKSAGAAYIDHNTTGQSLYVRVSNSSALDTTPITIQSSGAIGFNCTPQRAFDVRHSLNIFGSGGYTELMLRGRAGTAQNLGAFHFSIRSDVGGDNDDLMLLRFTGGNSPSYAGTSMHIRNDNGYVGIGDNIGQASSRLNIRGNSDVSDEDCMLTIDDVDGSSGSRIPSIMFRSVTGGVTTNQGRIRGTGHVGMVLSGSSAFGNDLVVQNTGIGIGAPSSTIFDSNITAYHATNDIKSLVKLWTNTADNTGTEGGAIEWVASGDKTAVGSKIAGTRVAGGGKMDLRFYTGRNTDSNHEKMRIDSSGNFMVGKIATGLGNQGAELSSTGQLKGTAPNQVVAYLNRTGSDGTIAEFRRDNSTVGSLASISGAYLGVRSNGGNLRLGADNTDYWSIDEYRLYPMNDAVDDIGLSSHRVRYIYLSGGVNFSDASGGIAYSAGNAANTLDDYEEGTWSPTLGGSGGSTGQSYNIRNGRYTKIGNFLHCTFDVQLSTLGTLSGTYVTLSNFPFSPYGSNQGGAISIGYSTGFTGNTAHPIRGYVSGSQCYLMEGGESSTGSNYIQVSENKIGASARIIGSITLSLA